MNLSTETSSLTFCATSLPEVHRNLSEGPSGFVAVLAESADFSVVAQIAKDRRFRYRLDVGYKRPGKPPIWLDRSIFCDGWEGRIPQLVKDISRRVPSA